MSEPIITLKNVCLSLSGKKVLTDINFEVNKGEFITIIGPSGGGKSTLLRIIAGLTKVGRGIALIKSKSAMVFQDYRLLPWRTVWQNVNLPRELTKKGLPPEEVLAQVGMLEQRNLYPHQLSGGMQARVAIARALAQDADVLLLDEPFSALDALVRERFNEELKRLHEKTKKTIIFVTHSIREAVYLGDRVAILRDGKLEAIFQTKGQGRITAFTQGIEAELRQKLGKVDSTSVKTPKMRQFPYEFLGVLILFIVGFGVWQLLSLGTSPLILPKPSQVFESFVNQWPLLTNNAFATLKVTLLGLFFALIIGIPIGYMMGRFKLLEKLLSPTIVALQAIPIVVIAPLLVTALGFGLLSRLIVTVLTALFPILVSTTVGVREVDRIYREVFQTIGASGLGILSKLEFPGSLPVVLGGLRLTVALALIGTVVGEFVFQGPGLGFLVNSERLNFHLPNAYAAVITNVILSVILYLIVSLLELWLTRYKRR